MLNELLKAALVLVISFLLRAVLTALGVDIDPELFNTIVAAIVAYVLAAFGVEVARAKAPKFFK
jgi:uncharacterized protein YacL